MHNIWIVCLQTITVMDFTQCIMQSVDVINCIEVLVMTSIVGECWRIICHYKILSEITFYNLHWLHSQ